MKGTRVSVDYILDMLAAGWKPEEVASEFDIPLKAVYEALRFASKTLKRVTVVGLLRLLADENIPKPGLLIIINHKHIEIYE